ncbi:unnamed protein product [Ectocarpus sp. 12 AP-2014]
MTASPSKALAYTIDDSWVRDAMKPQPRAAPVPALAIATNAPSASASNTAANATSAVPAATAFGGSISTQGVSLRGCTGHGNRVKHSSINEPKAPAIVATCEVIDRLQYHRQGYFVTPDEDSVATRFLPIGNTPSFRLANGDLAAEAATRYASVHQTV